VVRIPTHHPDSHASPALLEPSRLLTDRNVLHVPPTCTRIPQQHFCALIAPLANNPYWINQRVRPVQPDSTQIRPPRSLARVVQLERRLMLIALVVQLAQGHSTPIRLRE
jgi:hypothetical protein